MRVWITKNNSRTFQTQNFWIVCVYLFCFYCLHLCFLQTQRFWKEAKMSRQKFLPLLIAANQKKDRKVDNKQSWGKKVILWRKITTNRNRKIWKGFCFCIKKIEVHKTQTSGLWKRNNQSISFFFIYNRNRLRSIFKIIITGCAIRILWLLRQLHITRQPCTAAVWIILCSE